MHVRPGILDSGASDLTALEGAILGRHVELVSCFDEKVRLESIPPARSVSPARLPEVLSDLGVRRRLPRIHRPTSRQRSACAGRNASNSVNTEQSTLRKRLPLAIQSVVSIALLVLLFRSLDLAALRHLYATMPLGFYLISLAVVIGGQALYAWRWRQVLSASGVSVTLGTAISGTFIGIFLNNFFPSTVGGDMAKVYYLGRDHGYRPIAASIVLDRLLSIGLLAVLATAMYWIAPDPSPQFAATRLLVTAIAGFLLVGFVLAARGTGGLPQRLARFGTFAVGLAERAQRFRHDMAAAARRPQIVFQSAAVVTTVFSRADRDLPRIPADQYDGASSLSDAADGGDDRVAAQQRADIGQRPRTSRTAARDSAAATRRAARSGRRDFAADLRAPARLELVGIVVLAAAACDGNPDPEFRIPNPK